MTAAPQPAPLRLMVATPLNGGAEVDYLRGVIGLTSLAEKRGVALNFVFVSNNASIRRQADGSISRLNSSISAAA